MKDLHRFRTVCIRTLPFALLISLVFVALGGTPVEAKSSKRKGAVQIGFIGAPPPGFQSVLLNVAGVRINPKTAPSAGDGRWQDIPVPGGGQGTAGRPGDVQFDLNAIQNVPQLFNTALVRKGTYVLAELVLDPNNPGTLVPNCPQAGANEGCINYPMQLANAGQPLQVAIPAISVNKGTQSTLILQLSVAIAQIPTVSSGPYFVNLTVAPASNQSNNLGTVSGTVTISSGSVSHKKKIRSLTVSAEIAGTNTIVTSAPVQTKGSYILTLPAAGQFGTFYDLALSGGTAEYAATRLPALMGGGQLQANFSIKAGKTLASVSGSIADKCRSRPIIGAIIQLLIPPSNNSTADCTKGECVTVASGSTDNSGAFPLPGTSVTPAQLNNVPVLSDSETPYTLMATASGYDPLFSPVNAGGSLKKGGNCGTATTPVACDLSLTSAQINGTVSISTPPPGQSTIVQVFAEDAGTNKIESALSTPITIKSGNSSAPFTITVPSQIASYDLFATTFDLYKGVSDPYQGHTFAVLPGVLTPAKCGTTANQSVSSLDCTGHGSITGQVLSNPTDFGTLVGLSKNNVQLMQVPVRNLSSSSDPSFNNFSFCVPPDTYALQKLELPTPAPGTAPVSTPTPAGVGSPVGVTVPPPPDATPSASGTPCPTICSHPDGSCPGVCNNLPVNPL